MKHLTTLYPKNPHCRACQRARMHRRRLISKSADPPLTRFGEIVTADHIIANTDEAEGILGERAALSVYDLGTTTTDCYAFKDKTSDEAYAALQDFRGPKAYSDYVYTDNSPELSKALRDIGFPHGKSTPGIHQTNSHIATKPDHPWGNSDYPRVRWLPGVLLVSGCKTLLFRS